MDFALLPQVTVVGRISNRLSMNTARSGAKFVQLLVYMCHGKHAKLMPMIAFNKTARKLVNSVQQGDLMMLHSRIDPLRSGRFINPTLIVSEFSHLESLAIRGVYHGKKGKELQALFPVMPANYHPVQRRTHKNNKKRNGKSRSKHEDRHASDEKPAKPQPKVKKVKQADVEVVPKVKDKVKHKEKPKFKNKAKAKDPFKETNWVKAAEKLTDFDFPDLN